MNSDPQRWANVSPGNLSKTLPEVEASDPVHAVELAEQASRLWKKTPLELRIEHLTTCREALRTEKESLAFSIALEVGKPLREARLELDAVLAKFEFTFEDARRHLADRDVTDGPHPALVRSKSRGPAAVVAPFNFPLHLGHGASLAYLLAGSPVLFKPSPLAATTCAAYGAILEKHLPSGVFQIVQGWTQTARTLCLDPRVRSVCFTGSYPAGLALAKDLAADFSKSLALELGGKNCLIVCGDADLEAAATAAADAICLTAGQRCNATSRILVETSIESAFVEALLRAISKYQPGNPTEETTMLGPVVSRKSFDRYRALTASPGDWILSGEADDTTGYFVKPAVLKTSNARALGEVEFFCPVATLEVFASEDEAIQLQAQDQMGLTASVFTGSQACFERFAGVLEVGNLYHNLPTTFSPSTLPFGGLLQAGNGKPGGRGFARFVANEQAVQWKR